MKPLIAIEKDHRNAKERENSKVAMLCQPRNRDFGRLVTIRARFLGTLVGCRSAPINVVNVPIGRASTFGTITTSSRRSRSPLAILARVIAREDHFFLDGNSNLEKKCRGLLGPGALEICPKFEKNPAWRCPEPRPAARGSPAASGGEPQKITA